MGGGKGGGSQTTTQNQTSTVKLPDWIEAPAQQAVQTAQDLSQRGYQPYSEDPTQQVAQPNADINQAYQQIRDMQGMTNPAFATANNVYNNLAGGAQLLSPDQINALSNQLYGNYQNQVMQPAQGLLGGYLQGGPMTAQQVGQNTQALMSPYTSSVIDPTNQLMKQQLAQNLQTIGAGANNAGAFGGSRQGVQEGVAQSQAALGSEQYLGNLLNNQWNTSLGTGYNIANQGAQQGYNAATALAGMGQTGYNAAQSQAQALAGTNLQTGLQAAGALPGLATSQAQEAAKEAGALQTIGQTQQQQQQADINARLGQFYEQQNWPVQNLDILLGALGSVPYGSTTQTIGTSTQPSNRNPALGALGGAASGAALGTSLLGSTLGTGAAGGIGAGIGALLGFL